jgi:hypothetical protein
MTAAQVRLFFAGRGHTLHPPTMKELRAVKGTKMIDEKLAHLRTHRNNISRYAGCSKPT